MQVSDDKERTLPPGHFRKDSAFSEGWVRSEEYIEKPRPQRMAMVREVLKIENTPKGFRVLLSLPQPTFQRVAWREPHETIHLCRKGVQSIITNHALSGANFLTIEFRYYR
jgi:hypothetical protein